MDIKDKKYSSKQDGVKSVRRTKSSQHGGTDTYKGYQTTAPGKMTEKPGVKPSNTGPVNVPGGGVYGKKTAEVGRPKGPIPYYC